MSAGLYAATLASGYIYLQALISLKEKRVAIPTYVEIYRGAYGSPVSFIE